jgi:hypothetical protein
VRPSDGDAFQPLATFQRPWRSADVLGAGIGVGSVARGGQRPGACAAEPELMGVAADIGLLRAGPGVRRGASGE